MLQNHACEKDPFIVQDKPIDINGIAGKTVHG